MGIWCLGDFNNVCDRCESEPTQTLIGFTGNDYYFLTFNICLNNYYNGI